MAVKMYERVVLLLGTVRTWWVDEREFQWVGIDALDC
jgi:hypothetical protein